MELSSRFTAGTGLAITLCWVVALALTGATEALLFLAPALLIAIPLLGGRYVGEDLIARLVARSGPRSRRPRAASQSSPRFRASWPPRGTRLIAFSLAKRPPPLGLPQQT